MMMIGLRWVLQLGKRIEMTLIGRVLNPTPYTICIRSKPKRLQFRLERMTLEFKAKPKSYIYIKCNAILCSVHILYVVNKTDTLNSKQKVKMHSKVDTFSNLLSQKFSKIHEFSMHLSDLKK